MRTRLATLLAGALLLVACGGAQSTGTTTGRSPATTQAAGTAATDGALVVYSGRGEDLVAQLIDRFQKQSGIAMEVRYAGSTELATTLLAEGDQSPADVFFAQDPASLGAVKDLMQPLPDEIRSLVPDRFQDPEGKWVGTSGRSRVLVYNPELVAEDELPESIWELTDPAWSGRLGIAPTNGSFLAFVSAMILTEGEDRALEWLEGIAANQPLSFDGNSPIVSAVDAGDVAAGLVNHYYLLRLEAEGAGDHAANHFFTAGDPGALVMPAGAAVLSSAAHPAQALDFLQFLLGEETQAFFAEDTYEYPVINGAAPPAGQPSLDTIPTPDIDLSELATVLEQATDLVARAGLI
ncbi:MAG: iron ABC transporter substrate-binding protein [Acidimicrobiia bacterium]